MTEIFKRTTSS